jgi:hypothetical membrane protein
VTARTGQTPTRTNRPPVAALATGGIVGPAAFVTGWAVLGAQRPGYSPVTDAISHLAEVGASTRPWMTGAFVVFGTAVPVYAVALRRALPGPAWIAATATGLATLGVAALPLGRSDLGDTLHGVAAGTGYLTLAAVPLLAAGALRRRDLGRGARWSLAVGTICGACLAATVVAEADGLFQRAGLTAGDLWLAASAAWMLGGERAWPPAQPGRVS